MGSVADSTGEKGSLGPNIDGCLGIEGLPPPFLKINLMSGGLEYNQILIFSLCPDCGFCLFTFTVLCI